jgi:nicotinamidase-related amidase
MTHSLLIVIDLQKGWRHKTATEPAMMRTIELCKQFKGDVVHCRFRNDPNSLFHTQLEWYRFVDPDDTDEIPEIKALHLPTYWRTTYSCLNDEFLPVVKRYERVYIAGVFTDISVFTTAMGIFDLNIPVRVVADCVATLHGQSVHESALRSLEFGIDESCIVSAADAIADAA